jgi:hypothetical protein
MAWSLRVTDPITLRDGRVLVTLLDAANLFMDMSKDRQAHDWTSYAVELLMKAAESGSQASIESATRQVRRAVQGGDGVEARSLCRLGVERNRITLGLCIQRIGHALADIAAAWPCSRKTGRSN